MLNSVIGAAYINISYNTEKTLKIYSENNIGG